MKNFLKEKKFWNKSKEPTVTVGLIKNISFANYEKSVVVHRNKEFFVGLRFL